jgi:hypothetical protein
MHGGDTFVSFRARRTEHGYAVVVTRDDDALLISDTAVNSAALFQKSQHLRAAFRDMGYTPKRTAQRAPHLTGGVCWGPAAPVAAVVLGAIKEPTDRMPPAA